MIAELENGHTKSKFHTFFVNSIIRRYTIPSPLPDKIDDTVRKYLISHYENF